MAKKRKPKSLILLLPPDFSGQERYQLKLYCDRSGFKNPQAVQIEPRGGMTCYRITEGPAGTA